MKILAIARKTILELVREPQLLVLFLLFPAILVSIYYLGFGKSDKGMAEFLKIEIINEDNGPLGAQFITELNKTEFDGKPVFTIMVMDDRKKADIALMEGAIAAVVTIPSDFTQKILSENTANAASKSADVKLVGDKLNINLTFVSGFIDDALQRFAAKKSGAEEFIQPVIADFILGTGKLSDFQFGVPGLIVFGLLFLIVITATVVVREKVTGTLRRLTISKASAADILIGISVAQLLIAAVQIPLTFAAALIWGFKSHGSIWIAMLVGLIISFAGIGLGLIVAVLSKNDAEAANIGTGFILPMAFLSGAIFAVPPLPIGNIAGRIITFSDLLPSSHAAEALRRIFIYGDGIFIVADKLIAMTVLAIIYFIIGIFFYRRMQMRNS